MEAQEKVKKISKLENQWNYQINFPKTKFELISSILCRWWYYFDEPYKEFLLSDFETELKEKQLRYVSVDKWDKEENILNNQIKVWWVEGFNGVFEDSQGNLYDLRDPSKIISFKTLKAKSIGELVNILYACLKK